MVTRPGMTRPEIEARYGHGRSPRTIERWISHPEWPAPLGKRGRWLEYAADEVEAWVRKHAVDAVEGEWAPSGDPDDLLTAWEIAEYTRLAFATIRSDISRGRWPAPDRPGDGGQDRWRRATVNGEMKKRRAYRRGQKSL